MQRYECQDVQAVLSGLLDGELEADASHLAEAHLSQCAPCRAALQQAEETDELLRATMGAYEVWPTDLDRRIRTSIFGETDEAYAPHRRRLLFAAWSGWSIAAIVMLGFGLSFSRGWFDSVPTQDGPLALNDSGGGSPPAVPQDPSSAESPRTQAVAWRPPVGSDSLAKSIFDEGFEAAPPPTTQVAANDATDVPKESHELAMATEPIAEAPGPAGENAVQAERPFSPGAVAGVESEVQAAKWMQLLAMSLPAKPSPEPAPKAVVQEPDPKAIAAVAQEPTDVATGEVLHQASVLLTVLEQAGEGSFSDVRMVQQALSSDDVLERLASARSDLQSPDSVDLVNRAWSMLEWTNGSVDQDELERVKKSIAMQDLPRRLERLSDQYWN